MAEWLASPAGRYLLDWEQRWLDAAVADVFGFHALQLGLPQLDGLRANRMPQRWLADDGTGPSPPADLPAAALRCEFDALPFASQSLDLVLLPHALELARDPHDTLREVERVLRPEGQVVITGFNPGSLWGLRQRLGLWRRGIGLGGATYLPAAGEWIAYRRVRDWLRLLGFEVDHGRFGCWRPPLHSQRWLDRMAWVDRIGEQAWPVFGAAYMVVAVKRVRGMRLVGLINRRHAPRQAAPAAAAAVNRSREPADAS
jgi:SAM-dependent methyltransferase